MSSPLQPQPYQYPSRVSPASVSGLAITALILGIGAFLFWWVIVIGAIFGLIGLVVGLIAITRPTRGRGLGIGGTVAAGVGLIANIGFSLLLVTLVIVPIANYHEADERQEVAAGMAETPCYSYSATLNYEQQHEIQKIANCESHLEFNGKILPNGIPQKTDTLPPEVIGSISTKAMSVEDSRMLAPDSNVDTAVTALGKSYFPLNYGVVDNLKESVTLDGVSANLTRIHSEDLNMTKAVIVAFAPGNYANDDRTVNFFMVSIDVPTPGAEITIRKIIDTWDWKNA